MFFRAGLAVIATFAILLIGGWLIAQSDNPDSVVTSQTQSSGLSCKDARESVRLAYGDRVMGRCRDNSQKNVKVITTQVLTYTVQKGETGFWFFRGWKDLVEIQVNG